MSDRKQWLTRRPVVAGLLAATAAAIAGIGVNQLLPKHRRVTGPYADLVNNLEDPAAAAFVGTAILSRAADKTIAIREARDFAAERLSKTKLADAIAVDIAQGFVTEVNGWLIPITLGALCVLASQST